MVDAHNRYKTDPKFHAIVDALMCVVREGDFTLSDLRQAIFYADARIEVYERRQEDVEIFKDIHEQHAPSWEINLE